MRALIAFAALAMLFTGLVALSACPPAVECASQSDCPIGKVCNAKSTCVEAQPLGDAGFVPFDGGVIGGEGEGEGQGADVVQVGAAVALFQDDATLAPNALIAVSGALDGDGTFDPAAGTLNILPPVDDFTTLANGCGLDNVFHLTAADVGASVLPQGDETWFQCTTGPRILIDNDSGLQNADSPTTPASAQIAVLLGPYAQTAFGNEAARVVTAARGGTALQIIRIEPTDAVNNPRNLDTVAGVTFEHIAQVFPVVVDDATLGDVILVFDRGATAQKLVPLQREPQQSSWHGAPLTNGDNFVAPLTLPTDTDAIVFRTSTADKVDLETLTTSQDQDNTPNLIAIAPRAESGAGQVTFLRYEQELQTANSSNFILVHLNIGAGDVPVKPDDKDRVLLETVASGGDTFVYFSLTKSDHAWIFPIANTPNDDVGPKVVRASFLSGSQDIPNGMVVIPGDTTHAWFSFASTSHNNQELDRVTFLPEF